MENYSPVVDLRSNTRTTQYDQTFDNGFNPVSDNVFDKNTNIYVGDVTQKSGDIFVSFTANNNALVTMDFDLDRCVGTGGGILDVCGGFEGNWGYISFKGSGSYVINANMHANDDYTKTSGFFDFVTSPKDNGRYNLDISSALTFKATGNVGSFVRIATGSNSGYFKINTPYLEVDMDNNGANKNTQQYFIYTLKENANTSATIYLNADENNPENVDNQSNILKITGNIRSTINTRLYANFTNSDSFLKGNIELGSGSANITFSNGSSMTGNIDFLSDAVGTHTITFDGTSFDGEIKDTSKDGSNQALNRSENSSIIFKNTMGQSFGSTAEGVVDETYAGAVAGVFDVSSHSSTVIRGGADGSKGFLGKGTNALVFDFKGSANSGVDASKSFTVAGGNENSLYAFSGFNALDFKTLDGSNSVYAKLKDAGINIKAGAKIAVGNPNTNNVLQGTLFFQKTHITIGSNALFSTNEAVKIVGTGNDLNGLGLGAMFGNATWNDANRDGAISKDEVISNNGVNYKLDNGKISLETNEDANTSLGDIGSASDGIKKHIAFVFTDDTYLFGGGDEKDKADARYNKQGYSGTIRGGTTDSKYYFVNAGYVDRTQVDEAQGDLVLFNTAFHGDLGVKNRAVNIVLDFSNGRRGLKAIGGTGDANIVGAGTKDVVFNFTNNTDVIKFKGAVVGNAEETSSADTNKDTDTAKYTMLNLAQYKYKTGNSGETILDGDGSLKISKTRAGAGTTLIDAIQNAGLSGFNDNTANELSKKGYGTGQDTTNTNSFSTTKTTLSLRGTSLDATNMTFTEYIYDFAFGSGIGELEGVAIQDSKLKGVIDLTSSSAENKDLKHSFIFKGTAINGEAGVLATNGKLAGFSYDDSGAKYDSSVTFQLSGLYYKTNSDNSYVSNTNPDKVKGDSLIFTQTNLEGDLWADNSVTINLDFRDGRTWKMDNSGFFLKSGGNLIIHKEVANNKGSDTPTLHIATERTTAQKKIELINTGMQVKLLHKGDSWNENSKLADTFTLRGTSLSTHWGSGLMGNASDGLHGYADSGLNLVFAKGTNLDTTVTKTGGGNYKITDKELDSDATYGGTYSENGYTGNYIAESTLSTTKIITRSINAVFVGEGSYDDSQWTGTSTITGESSFAFINAGTTGSELDGSKLKNILSSSNATTTVTLEGTSLSNSVNGIVSANKDATTFNMTFVKGTSGTYISDLTNQYTDLTTTNAGGALKDSILKVTQSSLSGGIDFKDSNFNVLFVGNGSQGLSNTSVFKGGTANSTVTFRDSDLTAGNGTSSIQNIKGTVAFDLSHANEDMVIKGILSNMFGTTGDQTIYNGSGNYQTVFKKANTPAESVVIDKLVFVNKSDLTNANTLTTLQTQGKYFNDQDTFGELANNNYQEIGKIKNLSSQISSLTLDTTASTTIALKGANQEVVFIGADSHGFDTTTNATKLGDSSGSSLTFIDAGNLKLDNIVNIDGTTHRQTGSGTINLIGTTNFDLSGASNTLSLYKSSTDNNNVEVTGAGITFNAIFTGSNALGAGSAVSGSTREIPATHKTSTANIGKAGEQTIYHILFDYTSSNLTFGLHHAYTGEITGLTSDSVIKFRNAGYINGTQIINTDATILVDNTQIRGDFRGDIATLDFRKNKNNIISGGILSSDTTTAMVDGVSTIVTAENLSRKKLVFDLTDTAKANFSNAIQVGNKTGTDYGTTETSKLTFINAPAMTVGNDTVRVKTGSSDSAIALSIAKDIGFDAFATATTTAPTPSTGQNIGNKDSYILAGTELEFKGTNITANSDDKSITENLYSLNLSFDMSEDRGVTELGSNIGKSALTANSIVMGNATTPLNLSLNFKNKGSLNAPNGLNVKLKDNAIFNLNAESSNGNIGTIILSENTDQKSSLALNAQSSMTIAEGSMNFVGVFDTSASSGQASDYGTVKVSFNGTNKAYGIIKHKGDTTITLIGNALLSDADAKALGYTKTDTQFADLVIDATATDTAHQKTLTLNLAHTSGLVGIAGTNQADQYTNVDLSKTTGDIALKGNFNLTEDTTFGGDNTSRLKIVDTTLNLQLADGRSLNIAQNGLIASTPTSGIALKVADDSSVSNLTFKNIGDQISSITISPTSGYGAKGNWNIKGTNITLNGIVAENDAQDSNTKYSKHFIFANGAGTQTITNTELSNLTTEDKIANSSLTLSGINIFDSGSLTLIGKEALAGEANTHKFDGSNKTASYKTEIGLYNTILRSGDVLLDNTNTNAWTNGAGIDDVVEIRGTDTFNLSAKLATKSGGSGTNPNNSVINAVFVNGTTQANDTDSSVTGVRYIASNSYGSAYATNNAGGVLTSTELKTLESKAYGNISLDSGVKATMKFIGENSHSFDGKTKVDGDNVYYSANGSSWQQYRISDGTTTGETKGAVYLGTGTPSGGGFATLTGGSEGSRFDFDRTSVRLDLIKNAGGKTYVYNSTVIGDIAVNGGKPSPTIPANSSTTIIFNEQMSTSSTLPSASANFIQEYAQEGINLDLSVAHRLTADNLGTTDTNGTPDTNKVLGNTDKQTNLVFIGKGSVNIANNTANNNGGDSIDLSFMPTGSLATGYSSFTFVNAGDFTQAQVTSKAFGSNPSVTDNGNKTIFGTNAVVLIDTYVLGERAFAQKGFIDMAQTRNQKSSWTGGSTIAQNLIFDFNQGVYGDNQKIQFNGNSADAIANTSTDSSYIFTNIFSSGTKDQDRVLELSTNGLRTAINTQLKALLDNSVEAISDNVVGTLGLRGVSIKGNINENTTDGDKVDIVFNSTSNISFIDRFADGGVYDPTIQETGYNKLANIYGIDNEKSNISGYAILMSADPSKAVSISGNAKKTITFIGDKAVNGEVGGFENLSIEGGTADSEYTFHTVGTLSDGFLQGVRLQKKSGGATTANLGTFTFINSTIDGDIDIDNTSGSKLVFRNVAYSGEISGDLAKELEFGKGSGHIIISAKDENSVYDFSNLAGSSVQLDVNMKKSAGSDYYAPTITGFDGDVSLVGSLNLAKTLSEGSAKNSFTFKDSSSWTMTADSRVMKLTLSNTGTNYNLDLASAPRTKSANNDLRVLEVGELYANGGQVLLGTEIGQTQADSKSDKINANNIEGTLYVTAQDVVLKSKEFDTKQDAIVLVTAGDLSGEVKGGERKQGLSYAITKLEHQITVDNANWVEATQENANTASAHRWVLSAFDNQTNQELVDESAFVISNPYRMLMIETNNLNKRMGELRDNDYNQGSWIRVFNGMDSGEGAKNLYTNIQLGYDYGVSAIGAKNYTGVAFSTSIVDIDGDTFNGKSNTYSLAVYDSYIADNGLYVDTIAKYLYTDQKLSLNGTGSDSSFGNHAGSLGVEFGYRAYVADSSFYFEPQAELIAGVIAGVKDVDLGVVGGLNVMGELQTTFALNSRIGLVQGYTLKTESGFVADFRLGVSALNEYVSNENPIQLYDSIKTVGASMGNDTKLVLNVGTNLILTDQWRVYVDVEKSFLGKRNTDYQANVGARFSFGEKISSKQDLEKPMPLKLKSEEDKEISEEEKEDKSKNQEQSKASETKTEDKSSKKEAKK